MQHAGGYTFEEAQAIFAYCGRKHARGSYCYTIANAFEKSLRLKIRKRYVGKTVYRAIKGLPKLGTYIIELDTHIFTYKDGEIRDWIKSDSKCKIERLWKVKARKSERSVDKIIKEGRELVRKTYKSKSRRLRIIGE